MDEFEIAQWLTLIAKCSSELDRRHLIVCLSREGWAEVIEQLKKWEKEINSLKN